MLNIRCCTRLNTLGKVKRDKEDIYEHTSTQGDTSELLRGLRKSLGNGTKQVRRREWKEGKEESMS